MHSFRRIAIRSTLLLLSILAAAPAEAQVGGPPLPPPTLWNFLGIPQGIRKIQGATRNRNGNHPNREPKPPLKAIADPRNLESKDAAIKKAAEVKQAEDLKKQKIKAVKYLASIGCGCYNVDGGVTAALVASMSDCTEEVRYETIKAITEAAQGGCCSKCGSGCCCNKDILTAMAKTAYERDDHGCYLEPSERVRQAAAEALVACCPNSSPPVIVAPETPAAQPDREGGETLEPQPEDLREGEPVTPPPPTPPTPAVPGSEELPAADITGVTPGAAVGLMLPQESESDSARVAEGYGFGVVVDVNIEHQLAHVHFDQDDLLMAVGSQLGVYEPVEGKRKLVAVLRIVESFPGSANVTGDVSALATIARGDVVLRPPVMLTVHALPTVEVAATDVSAQPAINGNPHSEELTDEYFESSTLPTPQQAPAAQDAQVIEASIAAPLASEQAIPMAVRPRITATFLR